MRPLKILHTADWHLGLVSWRSHREVNRLEEQKECLTRLLEVAQQEHVDLILHAGDLFHQYYHPPREAIQLAVEAVIELSRVAPFVWVIGNHDWYAVEALQKVFPPKVVIIRDMMPRDFPDIEVTVFPVPYLPLSRFLAEYPGEAIQERAKMYLREAMRKWTAAFNPRHFHVLLGHLTVEELAFYAEANASREIFVRRADFPHGFSYGALGHLHGYTCLQDPFVLCYPSSLVPDNFRNPGEKGAFLLVELVPGEKPRVNPVFLETSSLVSIDLEKPLGMLEVRRLVEEQLRNSRRNYIRFRVRGDILSPEWMGELKNLRGERFEVVVVETLWDEEERQEEAMASSFDVAALPELFAQFAQEKGFSGEVVQCFATYYRQVLEGEKP
ncbi:MAG: exonuclease SbcCD subunit D [Candidatus Caldatribacterium sp.]|uniref:metallophosphoesterase family protein n=1 Tax=Candidatus Caldatribacterium sp. TaxID=2282143 RepID=UPI0029974124|nr:exonuclease SbcCD subunit D [Candidatus Caldatribacterium sp.]MCX7730813.1 exonuclease SbcCD subunit D [Candidatus Caldatribacterium sp.]MDW8080967.1 exonuclease SbcCD subunit D [Candidatus Calescibacterium sp.]